MAQTYVDDCYAAGHQATTDLQAFENNFAALKSAFSGTSAPSNIVAGMAWLDTTLSLLKTRNTANDAWNIMLNVVAAGLTAGDTFYASAANVLGILAKGTTYQSLNMNAGATAPQWQASLQSLMTAAGDIVVASAANTPAVLHIGTIGYVATVNSAGTGIEWQLSREISVVAGTTTLLASSVDVVTQPTGTYTKVKEIYCGRTGVVTVYFTMSPDLGAGYQSYVRIYVNGVGVGTERGSKATFSENITVSRGDYIQLYMKSTGNSYFLSDMRVYCSDPAASIKIL
jgi:hypothetical protein